MKTLGLLLLVLLPQNDPQLDRRWVYYPLDLREQRNVEKLDRVMKRAAASGYNGFVIEDAGSTNGTLVNGDTVRRKDVVPGDRIQLGPDVVLQLGWFDETEEALANRLVEAARRDVLTGALNRRAFEERFAAELAYATRHREKLVAIANGAMG